MELNLNEKKVRAMAGRLRQALTTIGLTHSRALEVVSQTFGYPNWDTLAGMLKRERPMVPVTPKLAKPVLLFIEAFSCDEYGEGPSWAKITIDQEFLDTVAKLQQLCVDQSLEDVAKNWLVDAWGGADELLIRGEELKVGRYSWWIRARPKHTDYDVETRLLDIERLFEALRSGTSDQYLVWRKDVLVYDPSGNAEGLIHELVDANELDGSYVIN